MPAAAAADSASCNAVSHPLDVVINGACDHLAQSQHAATGHLVPCLQERNYFDSADWALSKQGKKPENMAGAAPGPPPTALPPKLEPNSSDHLKPRRSSHLGELEAASSLASGRSSS